MRGHSSHGDGAGTCLACCGVTPPHYCFPCCQIYTKIYNFPKYGEALLYIQVVSLDEEIVLIKSDCVTE